MGQNHLRWPAKRFNEKGNCRQAWPSWFNPQDPPSRERETTPKGCPSDLHSIVCHAQIHTHQFIKSISKISESTHDIYVPSRGCTLTLNPTNSCRWHLREAPLGSLQMPPSAPLRTARQQRGCNVCLPHTITSSLLFKMEFVSLAFRHSSPTTNKRLEFLRI